MLKKTSAANLCGAFQLSANDTHRRTDPFDAIRLKLAPHSQCDGMCRQNTGCFVVLPLCSAVLEETQEEESHCEYGSSSTLQERQRAILPWVDNLPSSYELSQAAGSCSLSEKNQSETYRAADADNDSEEEWGSRFGEGRRNGKMRDIPRNRVTGDTSSLNDHEKDDYYDSDVERTFCHHESVNFYHAQRPYEVREPKTDDHYDTHFDDNLPRYHGYHSLPTVDWDVRRANTAKYGQQEGIVVPQPRTLVSTRDARALLSYRAPSTGIIKSNNPFNPFVKRMLERQNDAVHGLQATFKNTGPTL